LACLPNIEPGIGFKLNELCQVWQGAARGRGACLLANWPRRVQNIPGAHFDAAAIHQEAVNCRFITVKNFWRTLRDQRQDEDHRRRRQALVRIRLHASQEGIERPQAHSPSSACEFSRAYGRNFQFKRLFVAPRGAETSGRQPWNDSGMAEVKQGAWAYLYNLLPGLPGRHRKWVCCG